MSMKNVETGFKYATLSAYPDEIAGYTVLDEDDDSVGIYVRDAAGGLWPARTVLKADAAHCQTVCEAWLRRAGINQDLRKKAH